MEATPALPTLSQAYQQGYEAASKGEPFTVYCPFLWPRMQACGIGIADFNHTWRPALDAWFDGWKAYLDEHGLGFDMHPRGERFGKRHHAYKGA